MFGRMDDFIMRFIIEPISIGGIVVLGLGVYIGIPLAVYTWLSGDAPQTIELRADEWTCTKTHERDAEVCTKGCRWVRVAVCDQWNRKP